MERGTLGDLPKLPAPSQERPVDAAPVHDEPGAPSCSSVTCAVAGNEQLGIGLERDVVDRREATHGDSLAESSKVESSSPSGG